MELNLISFIHFSLCWLSLHAQNDSARKMALVTLITGNNTNTIGYVQGALTLANSLIVTQSKLHRIVMVTPDVPKEYLSFLKELWEVHVVQTIACIPNKAVLSMAEQNTYWDHIGEFHVSFVIGDDIRNHLKRWSSTCTKFAAWTLTKFDQVIFMDSDMIVAGSIDHVMEKYNEHPFYAAPDKYPPDTLNSGDTTAPVSAFIYN